MGLPCARQEDIVMGMCYHESHKTPIQFIGIIMGGASISKLNNKGIAQESNIVIGSCGHIGTIVTSSSLTSVENLGMARQFDLVTGENIVANIITSSGDVQTG
jgi:hypothetical protein